MRSKWQVWDKLARISDKSGVHPHCGLRALEWRWATHLRALPMELTLLYFTTLHISWPIQYWCTSNTKNRYLMHYICQRPKRTQPIWLICCFAAKCWICKWHKLVVDRRKQLRLTSTEISCHCQVMNVADLIFVLSEFIQYLQRAL